MKTEKNIILIIAKILDIFLTKKRYIGFISLLLRIPEWLNRRKMNYLKKESLGKTANARILKEIRLSFGLFPLMFKENIFDLYKQFWIKKLDKIRKASDVNWSDFDIEEIANQLVNKKPSQLPDELALVQHSALYNALLPEQAKNIDKLLIQTKMLNLAKDADYARRFQNAYIIICDKVLGYELTNTAKSRSSYINLQMRDISFESDIRVEYQSLKSVAYILPNSKKNKLNNQEIKQYWDKINMNPLAKNYRRQTGQEIHIEKRLNAEYDRVKFDIKTYNEQYNISVMSPEFLLESQLQFNPLLTLLQLLERKEINHMVRQALSNDTPTILVGELYMSMYLTGSKIKYIIDRIYRTEEHIINNDMFIASEEEYIINQKLAACIIFQLCNELKKVMDISNVLINDIPALLKKQYNSINKIGDLSLEEAIFQFKQSVAEIEFSEGVLTIIDRRRLAIREEIEKHTEMFNNALQKMNLSFYNPSTKPVITRVSYKIDDLVKKIGEISSI